MLEKYNEKNPLQGNLFLTPTELTFIDTNDKKETWVRNFELFFFDTFLKVGQQFFF